MADEELKLLREQHKKLKEDYERMMNEKNNNSEPSSRITLFPHDYQFDERWADIDRRIEMAIIRRTNENKQYAMRKNVLFHKVKDIPRDKHGYAFNKWCIDLINSTFVNSDNVSVLRRPLVPEDIDRAHVLRTKRRDANVVLVQFMNMTVRNEVFFAKSCLKGRGSLSVSEHLTPESIELLNLAKSKGEAWSSDGGKIFLKNKSGEKRVIRSPHDLASVPVRETHHKTPRGRSRHRKLDGKGRPPARSNPPRHDLHNYPTRPQASDGDAVYSRDPRSSGYIDFANCGNYDYYRNSQPSSQWQSSYGSNNRY